MFTRKDMLVPLERRLQDKWGDGRYGATRRRGDKTYTHQGVDFLLAPRETVYSPVDGEITRFGLVQSGQAFQYIELAINDSEYRVRIMYAKPNAMCFLGEEVLRGAPIGTCEDLGRVYTDEERGTIPNHIHVEVLTLQDGRKVRVDPDTVLTDLNLIQPVRVEE